MRKEQINQNNYLEKKPVHKECLNWSQDSDGKIALEMENKGAVNRVFQKLFKKPKISYIHLDEMGSFIWPLIDGEKNIFEIGELVDGHFGEKAHPLYERLSQYFRILENYGFITFK